MHKTTVNHVCCRSGQGAAEKAPMQEKGPFILTLRWIRSCTKPHQTIKLIFLRLPVYGMELLHHIGPHSCSCPGNSVALMCDDLRLQMSKKQFSKPEVRRFYFSFHVFFQTLLLHKTHRESSRQCPPIWNQTFFFHGLFIDLIIFNSACIKNVCST